MEVLALLQQVGDIQARGDCRSDGKEQGSHYNFQYSAVRARKTSARNSLTRVLEPLENPFGPKVLPMSLGTLFRAGPADFGGQCRARTCDLLLVRQAL